MSLSLSTLLENPAAAAFGTAGLACQLIWPLLKRRKAMLGVQMGIGSNYGIQYATLDAWSGAAVCALGASQTAIALLAGDRPWLRKLGLAFLPILFTSGFFTWSGLPTLLALSACSLIMIGRLQKDTLRLRQFMLASVPFGMSYDLSVGAAPALIGSCVSLAISLFALRRELRNRAARNSGRASEQSRNQLTMTFRKGGAYQTASTWARRGRKQGN